MTTYQEITPAIESLIPHPQWVGYTLPDKHPQSPVNVGSKAKSNDPKTWGTYEQALALMDGQGWDGIGFACYSETVPIVFIDLDHCVKNGVIADWAMDIVKQVNSYSEISPSGDGVHILAYGYIAGAIPALRVTEIEAELVTPPEALAEIYADGRYFTVTNNHLDGTPQTIEHRPREILTLHTTMNARLNDYKERLKRAKTRLNGHRNGTSKHHDPNDTLSQVKNDVLSKYTFDNLVDFAVELFPGKTERADKGGTRILGYGGLIVYDTDPAHWKNYSENIGGDAINLAAQHLFSDHKATGRNFIDALAFAGGFVGVDVKSALARVNENTTASNRTDKAADDNAENSFAEFSKYTKADDEGNAVCFLEMFPNSFLANHRQFREEWLFYNGKYWESEGAESKVERCIVQVLDERAKVAKAAIKAEPDEEKQKIIRKTLDNFKRNAARLNGCKTFLRSHVHSVPESFDTDLDAINCSNGWIDLRTGTLYPHEPQKRFTYCIQTDYNPDADYMLWENQLHTILLDESVPTDAASPELDKANQEAIEKVEYLKVAAGHSLTGRTSEECLFYLVGETRAGKGTYTETVDAVLGEPLSTEVDFATFTEKRDNDAQNFDLAGLKASRVVFASEPDKYQRLNAGRIKNVTGGNKTRCAFKGKTHFTYKPQYKLWLTSNFEVNADASDPAIWARVKVISFPNSYLGREDKTLKRKMLSRENKEAVLKWMVEGAVTWYASGLGEPKSVTVDTIANRDANDNVKLWLEDCTEHGIGFEYETPTNQAYLNYTDYCESYKFTPKSYVWFSRDLRGRVIEDEGRVYPNKGTGRTGIPMFIIKRRNFAATVDRKESKVSYIYNLSLKESI